MESLIASPGQIDPITVRGDGVARSICCGLDATSTTRPLWLLPEPQQWRRKWRQTPFSADPRFTGDPERIESGWWDGREMRRDYHVVIGAAGEKLWLYRDCQSHDWYLHGIFG